MKMSNKIYDVLKWVALVVLPAVAIFYESLAGIWGLPFPEQIPDTIMIVDLLLGTLLGVSSANYKKTNSIEEVK